MKNLFILGAGAAASAGAPLMNDFFSKGEKLYKNGKIGINDPQFQEIINIFSDFQQNLYGKSNLDLNNFEEFLGIIEMGFIIDKAPNSKLSSVDDLKKAINKFIVQTIEWSMPFKRNNNRIYPVRPYGKFIEELSKLKDERTAPNQHEFSFITFNYDLGLDHALLVNGFGLNYHLNNSKSNNLAPPLLKLHGSINWGKCKKCKKIIPYNVNSASFNPLFGSVDEGRVFYDLGTNISRIEHCKEPLEKHPIIIPPTWNKTQYHGLVSSIWKKAAKELALAENIFIIGYSLPASDMFFRYLYSLGSNSRTIIKNLVVIDIDPNVDKKYEGLFGGLAKQNYQFIQQPFEPTIQTIINIISSS